MSQEIRPDDIDPSRLGSKRDVLEAIEKAARIDDRRLDPRERARARAKRKEIAKAARRIGVHAVPRTWNADGSVRIGPAPRLGSTHMQKRKVVVPAYTKRDGTPVAGYTYSTGGVSGGLPSKILGEMSDADLRRVLRRQFRGASDSPSDRRKAQAELKNRKADSPRRLTEPAPGLKPASRKPPSDELDRRPPKPQSRHAISAEIQQGIADKFKPKPDKDSTAVDLSDALGSDRKPKIETRNLDDVLDDLQAKGFRVKDRTDLIEILDVLQAAGDSDALSAEKRAEAKRARGRMTKGTTTTADGAVGKTRRLTRSTWDPADHPRDPLGRFTEALEHLAAGTDVKLPSGLQIVRDKSVGDNADVFRVIQDIGQSRIRGPKKAAEFALRVERKRQRYLRKGATTTADVPGSVELADPICPYCGDKIESGMAHNHPLASKISKAVFEECPDCSGEGKRENHECEKCDGQGTVPHRHLEKAEQFTKPGIANVSPEDLKKLRPLIEHYRKMAHPFRSCKRDQIKHGLSEDHANRRCGVLKQLGLRKDWRGRELVVKSSDAWTDEVVEVLDRLGEQMEKAARPLSGAIAEHIETGLRKARVVVPAYVKADGTRVGGYTYNRGSHRAAARTWARDLPDADVREIASSTVYPSLPNHAIAAAQAERRRRFPRGRRPRARQERTRSGMAPDWEFIEQRQREQGRTNPVGSLEDLARAWTGADPEAHQDALDAIEAGRAARQRADRRDPPRVELGGVEIHDATPDSDLTPAELEARRRAHGGQTPEERQANRNI